MSLYIITFLQHSLTQLTLPYQPGIIFIRKKIYRTTIYDNTVQ